MENFTVRSIGAARSRQRGCLSVPGRLIVVRTLLEQLVSAGFDAHRLDLALNASYEGFAALAGVVRELAEAAAFHRSALVAD